MPHISTSGNDELSFNDEVKIYNHEEDVEDEQQKSSENLTEDKCGLVFEGEIQNPIDIGNASKYRQDATNKLPFPSGMEHRLPGYLPFPPYAPYTANGTHPGFGGKMSLMPHVASPFNWMTLYEAFSQPPPAHRTDQKSVCMSPAPFYGIPTPPPGYGSGDCSSFSRMTPYLTSTPSPGQLGTPAYPIPVSPAHPMSVSPFASNMFMPYIQPYPAANMSFLQSLQHSPFLPSPSSSTFLPPASSVSTSVSSSTVPTSAVDSSKSSTSSITPSQSGTVTSCSSSLKYSGQPIQDSVQSNTSSASTTDTTIKSKPSLKSSTSSSSTKQKQQTAPKSAATNKTDGQSSTKLITLTSNNKNSAESSTKLITLTTNKNSSNIDASALAKSSFCSEKIESSTTAAAKPEPRRSSSSSALADLSGSSSGQENQPINELNKSTSQSPNKSGSNSNSASRRVHIKKPLNAFMLFMKEMRPKVQEECTLKESAAINQILGKKWHELPKDEQYRYYEQARLQKEEHARLYPTWSARDNYAMHSKRKKKRNSLHDGGRNSNGDANSDSGNPKKCRARYGLEQQNLWCKPCKRKKKCIRFISDPEELDDGIHSDNGANDSTTGPLNSSSAAGTTVAQLSQAESEADLHSDVEPDLDNDKESCHPAMSEFDSGAASPPRQYRQQSPEPSYYSSQNDRLSPIVIPPPSSVPPTDKVPKLAQLQKKLQKINTPSNANHKKAVLFPLLGPPAAVPDVSSQTAAYPVFVSPNVPIKNELNTGQPSRKRQKLLDEHHCSNTTNSTPDSSVGLPPGPYFMLANCN